MAKEEKNEAFTIKFRPSLMAKVEDYIKEADITKASFFNDVVADFFEGKVLTNDFITLENYFYFNFEELKENGIVKASSEVPIHDLNNCYIVKKIPNNLDSWNKKEGTYSSSSSNIHKGIYTLFIVVFVEEDFKLADVIEKYLLFKYDSLYNELEISLVPFEDLYLYVPTTSTILEELEEDKDSFYNSISSEETNIVDVVTWLSTFEVVQSFLAIKKLQIFYKSDRFKEIKKRLQEIEKTSVNDVEGYVISDKDFNELTKPIKNVHVKEELSEEEVNDLFK